jgi:hypothetical protein
LQDLAVVSRAAAPRDLASDPAPKQSQQKESRQENDEPRQQHGEKADHHADGLPEIAPSSLASGTSSPGNTKARTFARDAAEAMSIVDVQACSE